MQIDDEKHRIDLPHTQPPVSRSSRRYNTLPDLHSSQVLSCEHNSKREKRATSTNGIHTYRTARSMDIWPPHLQKTFHQIRKFKSVDFESFLKEDGAEQNASTPIQELLWKEEIKFRATKIVETTADIVEYRVSEMELRLRLEDLVLERFKSETDCPSCKGKLWGLDAEAEVEIPGAIAKNLESRRKGRELCQCEDKWRQNVKNSKIFTTRADEMMLSTKTDQTILDVSDDVTALFDSEYPETSTMEPIRRRPDRILGFRETNSFRRLLDRSNQNAIALHGDGINALRQLIDCTVLNHKGNLLLFPFLIIEAKSGSGAGFNACDVQTSSPIVQMLKKQEALQAESQVTLEYGGPLLWYIAYRGEDWRLSVCFTGNSKSGRPTYQGIRVWNGLLNDCDAALQLLLIIDYIFDWARDVYRPSIMSQLFMLANPTKFSDGFQSNGSFLEDADSDIFSYVRSKDQRDMAGDGHSLVSPTHPESIQDWRAAIDGDDTPLVPDEEQNIMNWATHDSKFGLFRPACSVQNIFRSVFVTKDNIDALLSSVSSVSKRCTAAQLARDVIGALDTHRTALMSEDMIDRMEEVWTNRTRPKTTGHILEQRLFATIAYHTVITGSWELQRIIFCLVFDEEALNRLNNVIPPTKSAPTRKPLEIFSTARKCRGINAENLMKDLKDESIQENLASALASKRLQLNTCPGTSRNTPYSTFRLSNVNYFPEIWTKETFEVVNKVYNWCVRNSEEPTESFLRVSYQWNSLAESSTGATVASYFKKSKPLAQEKYILVANLKNYYDLCVFMLPGHPGEMERRREALRNLTQDNMLYDCCSGTRTSNVWGDVCKEWLTVDAKNYIKLEQKAWNWRKSMRPDHSKGTLPASGKPKLQASQKHPLIPSTTQPTNQSPSSSAVSGNESNLKHSRDNSDIVPSLKRARNEVITLSD